jgi:subtilisin family serine protease
MIIFSKKVIYFILIDLLLINSLVLVWPQPVKAQFTEIPISDTHELLIKLKNNERIYKVTYPASVNILEMLKLTQGMPSVDLVELNYSFHASYVPNDTFYVEEWNLDKIGAPKAWDIVQGGSENIVVAVLDTGVDIDHPDLKNNIWVNSREIQGNGVDDDKNGYIDDYQGWDFIRNTSDPRPKFDESYVSGAIHHGTIVSGIIAATANNHQGLAGLAWNAKIMPLRVLNSQGSGSIDAVIRAVNYAKNNGAKIINLSFVGTNRSELLAQALKDAWRSGVVIVAAAGNEASGQTENLDAVPSYPICLDANDPDNYIIGVGATDPLDHKASFSNYGSGCLDIMAPGSRVYGLLARNTSLPDYQNYYGGYWSGTSVAVPLVSATAALLKSLNPFSSSQQVRDAILSKTDNIDLLNPEFSGELGKGRLNTYKAVNYVYSQLAQSSQSHYVVTAAGPGGGPHVRIMKSNGSSVDGFMAYKSNFTGGVRVATGDVDGDGLDEIITVPASSSDSLAKVFDLNGNLKAQFAVLKNYRRGLNVTSCDLNDDGVAEIVFSTNGISDPVVYVFNGDGRLKNSFLAYSKTFRGEVKVACGDINNDGQQEIVTGPGAGGGPQIRIFDAKGKLQVQWYAFLDKFRGGVNLALGDVDGDGKLEIVTSIASGASPYLRVFDYFGFLQTQFLAYDHNYFNGVTLAVDDLNDDGIAEIVTGVGKGMTPQVNIFDYLGINQGSFLAYDRKFLGGVNLAIIKNQQ